VALVAQVKQVVVEVQLHLTLHLQLELQQVATVVKVGVELGELLQQLQALLQQESSLEALVVLATLEVALATQTKELEQLPVMEALVV
jgi:hypothetical protein